MTPGAGRSGSDSSQMGKLTLKASLLIAAGLSLSAGLAPLAAAEFGDSSIIELESALAEQRAFVDFQAEELTASESLHAERHAAYREAEQHLAARQAAAQFAPAWPVSDDGQRNVARYGTAGAITSAGSSVLPIAHSTAVRHTRSCAIQRSGTSAAVDASVQRLYFAIRNGYHGGGEAFVFLPPAAVLSPARTRSLYFSFYFRTPFSGELT